MDNPPIKADLALTVEDKYQGIGIGTALFQHLILIAKVNGVESMEADVLHDNQSMLNILLHCGLPHKKFTTQGETHFSLFLEK
jgi:GNAT superfamily N-acetyltransferase